jgi:hypothetical protein
VLDVVDAGVPPRIRAIGVRAEAIAGLWWDLATGLIYLAGAVLVLGGLWAHPGGVETALNTQDPTQNEWMLVHATRIFTHGENPLASPQLNAPLGENVMANVGLLGLTIPLVPVTLLFGPAVADALLTTIALAGTAIAWYLVLSRRLVTHRLAAAVAGGFAGFAPGIVNHANGHPQMVAVFLIPVIIWRALALGEPDRRPAAGEPNRPLGPDEPDRRRRVWLREGIILGLLVTWQAFLSEEMLFLAALASALFVAGYAIFRPRRVGAAVRPFLRGASVATLTAGVLLAYPLWYQFAGPQNWHGLPKSLVRTFGADLASYPSFAKLSLIGQPVADRALSRPVEESTFFGWPLLVVAVLIVVWLWRRVEVRALAIVGLIFVGLSLGQILRVGGHQVGVPTPWGRLVKLPLFDSVVPVRIGLALIPVLALLLALAVDKLLAQPSRALLAIGLVAIAAALVPVIPRQLPVKPRPAIPVFITSGDWRHYVAGDQSMLNADTTLFGNVHAMAWDNAVGQEYRVVRGYFLGPDPTGRGTFSTWLLRPTGTLLAQVGAKGGVPMLDDRARARARADVRFWNASLVVLDDGAPHAADLRATLIQLFGPGQRVDDVWLWVVTPD